MIVQTILIYSLHLENTLPIFGLEDKTRQDKTISLSSFIPLNLSTISLSIENPSDSDRR